MIKYFKSKTVWFNILMVLLAALNAYFEVIMEPAYYAAFTVVYGSISTYLRSITTKPLEKL